MSSIDEMMELDHIATIKAVREYADRIDKESEGFFDRMSCSGSSDTGGNLYYNTYMTRGQISGEIDETEPEEEEDPQLLFDPKELVLNND